MVTEGTLNHSRCWRQHLWPFSGLLSPPQRFPGSSRLLSWGIVRPFTKSFPSGHHILGRVEEEAIGVESQG